MVQMMVQVMVQVSVDLMAATSLVSSPSRQKRGKGIYTFTLAQWIHFPAPWAAGHDTGGLRA